MYEGKIIKYFREKYQLTQEQLGKGICSDTHISKIERSQTEYAPDIIKLLSNRLGINMSEKIQKLDQLKSRISDWHNVIVMELKEEIDTIHCELKQEELVHISEYCYIYKLLYARYLLSKNKPEAANLFIKEIQKKEKQLTGYERNLLKHVLGIYYLSINDYHNAINTLKTIRNDIYNNPEFYYHLAIAYHSVRLPVLAYFYAQKSRQFFEEKKFFLRVIDAEIIMIVQAQDNVYNLDVINRFKSLIHSSELCGSLERKAKVTHNLAYEYYRLGDMEQARNYYKESMILKEKESSSYLLSLEGYIRSCYEGGLLSRPILLDLVTEGVTIANQKKLKLYIHLFKLLSYLIKSNEQRYYQYLQEKALPMFEKYGFIYLVRRSKRELFEYYRSTERYDIALDMADYFVKSNIK
ncbi:helix-turn-helix transcriptional regulator [Sutcliffiella horikoshii]|uniref:Helix-turn-helix transcriptional regulator n=1 Tax=Sutcliffiella horikoshii TaxID=79883 RepID=A0A5D4SYU2_9BACI|nr:helix-turn-helix transcriptional regulator [Sutcliffiella horikoshii]TYS67184.1 helix-turn-helix transcriptional regulator [Sutcliffiella horikoshii]